MSFAESPGPVPFCIGKCGWLSSSEKEKAACDGGSLEFFASSQARAYMVVFPADQDSSLRSCFLP